jgi:hypothetical protein
MRVAALARCPGGVTLVSAARSHADRAWPNEKETVMNCRNPAKLPSLFCALLLATQLGACRSAPEPVAEMASARTAISGVRGTGAADLAPVELDRATTKLVRAEAAMNAKRYDEARRLAEEARADAELAAAMASAVQAERGADELAASIEMLRREIERAQGAQ